MLSKPKKAEAENDRSVFEIRFIEYNKKRPINTSSRTGCSNIDDEMA